LAVYTEVPDDEMAAFVARYDIGDLLAVKGIAEGVSNSNFLLHTSKAFYILTLYEERTETNDLPFFIGLMEHLARRGINCPLPVKARDGQAVGHLAGRPAAIVTFLDGISVKRPNANHCAEVGKALARLHEAGADFGMERVNSLSVPSWRPFVAQAGEAANTVSPGLAQRILAEVEVHERSWPNDLPRGVIHADLFPNNVFFIGDELSGLIDFYFACTDAFAFDIATCLNAWCFEADASFNLTKGQALLAGYESVRRLEPAEAEALPQLCRGAALRFLLTRLVDWLNVPPGALVMPHDPLEYDRKLVFHQRAKDARDYGLRR
jgi:homoserine kinase type II